MCFPRCVLLHELGCVVAANKNQINATVTADKAAAWLFTLEGEYKDDQFKGKLIGLNNLFKFGVQPPEVQIPGTAGTVSYSIICLSGWRIATQCVIFTACHEPSSGGLSIDLDPDPDPH